MKRFSSAFILYLFVIISVTYSIDTNWNNNGGDRLWRTSANWSAGLPTGVDKAGIRGNHSADGPIIDSSTTAVANNIVIGDWSSSADSLEMTGGTLAAGGWCILGYGSSNNGTMTFTNGTATIGNNLDVGFNGTGTLHMNGGSITINSRFGIAQNAGSAGNVFLDGGTITAGMFHMTSGGTLDITAGTLIVNGNITSAIAAYVAASQITAYNGDGDVLYDTTTNPGKTTIWADDGTPAPGNGDVNGDRYVDEMDLLLFLAEWLETEPDPNADFTRDGEVDLADY